MNKLILLLIIGIVFISGCVLIGNNRGEGKTCVRPTNNCYESFYEEGFNHTQVWCNNKIQRFCWVYNETVINKEMTYEEAFERMDSLKKLTNCWEGCEKFKKW